MDSLVKELITNGVLKTPRIIEAFQAIDRKDFVPKELAYEAYGNYPLQIGHGQTISQPYTVALMIELLAPELGNKIMDVGSGSGWQTALLAHIVGPEGKIFGIELVPELKEMGERNVSKYNFVKKGIVKFRTINAEVGIPEEAPFDCIIAGASAQKMPQAWKEQLKVGGRIVMPIRESIYLFTKNKDGSLSKKEYPGFIFVPFISKN